MPRKRKQDPDFVDLTGLTDEEDVGRPFSRTQPDSDEKAAPKRKRKAPGKVKEKPEKRVDAAGRTVRWSSQPSIQVRERIARAMPGSGHRLFLIDRRVLAPVGSENGAVEEFAVLGATGNVYTVTICRQPACTCPDFLKGNLCKHILFVMLRVLRLPREEPLVWQRALLTQEVDSVLGGEKSERRGGDNVLAGEAVRAEYRRLSNGGGGAGPSGEGAGAGKQRPVEGSDCPICFEPMSPAATSAEDKVTFCAGSCGNNVHMGCMRRWISNERSQGLPATCPLCRAQWVDGLDPGGPQPGQPKEYANLAQLSQAHQGADTSLDALYGDRAVWVRANQGGISRRQAASMWRTMHGGW